jgi:hypothetical protein
MTSDAGETSDSSMVCEFADDFGFVGGKRDVVNLVGKRRTRIDRPVVEFEQIRIGVAESVDNRAGVRELTCARPGVAGQQDDASGWGPPADERVELRDTERDAIHVFPSYP